MEPHALAPYELSLHTGLPLQLAGGDGRLHDLDVGRWLGDADAADRAAVDRTRGPCLDVGCGPGRIVQALSDAGRFALGIDIAARAVALTRSRGQNALRRDVFGPLPGEGRWGSVVLLDGNIGIGGDPERLLGRASRLLVPGGTVVVETHPDDAVDETGRVRFATDGTAFGPAFAWSVVGAAALERAAVRCGFAPGARWRCAGRPFTELVLGARR